MSKFQATALFFLCLKAEQDGTRRVFCVKWELYSYWEISVYLTITFHQKWIRAGTVEPKKANGDCPLNWKLLFFSNLVDPSLNNVISYKLLALHIQPISNRFQNLLISLKHKEECIYYGAIFAKAQLSLECGLYEPNRTIITILQSFPAAHNNKRTSRRWKQQTKMVNIFF